MLYYTIIIISNDNARLQDPIFLLKIPMSTRKNFAENYRQFWHMLSKRFASPGPGIKGRIILKWNLHEKH
jgi:hypothetical protein